MDWYPTLATLAGMSGPILDGLDLSSLLIGETDKIPLPSAGSLNSSLPLRRPWNPPAEWAALIERTEYQNAFFYHGSQGALAAVRSGPWKLFLNPNPTLYNLADDPGEKKPVFQWPDHSKTPRHGRHLPGRDAALARRAGEVELGKHRKEMK